MRPVSFTSRSRRIEKSSCAKFLAIITISHPRFANAEVSPLSIFIGILLVTDWLYAIVDAPFVAAKTPANDVGPTVDKTGWEV